MLDNLTSKRAEAQILAAQANAQAMIAANQQTMQTFLGMVAQLQAPRADSEVTQLLRRMGERHAALERELRDLREDLDADDEDEHAARALAPAPQGFTNPDGSINWPFVIAMAKEHGPAVLELIANIRSATSPPPAVAAANSS
jgi:hypothetical protein